MVFNFCYIFVSFLAILFTNSIDFHEYCQYYWKLRAQSNKTLQSLCYKFRGTFNSKIDVIFWPNNILIWNSHVGFFFYLKWSTMSVLSDWQKKITDSLFRFIGKHRGDCHLKGQKMEPLVWEFKPILF